MVISLTVLNIMSVIQAVIMLHTSVLRPAWASLVPVSHEISYLFFGFTFRAHLNGANTESVNTALLHIELDFKRLQKPFNQHQQFCL